MLYKQFATNKESETLGIWVEYQDDETEQGKSPRFLVARAGGANTEYAKALERQVKPFRKQIQMGALPMKALERIQKQVFCETVLREWQNVTDAEGKPIPFNYENALKVMTDLPDLYEDLHTRANSMANFRDEVREGEAKN